MTEPKTISCRLVVDDKNSPIVLHLNAWRFWSKDSRMHSANHSTDGELVCDRSSGPSDYHAEWRRFESGEYKLLVGYFENTDPSLVRMIKTLNSIGQVMAYCATHMHPDLHFFGRDEPIVHGVTEETKKGCTLGDLET